MWTVQLPPVDEVEAHLDAALSYANGTPVYSLSPTERGALLAVYQAYDQLLGQPHACLRPVALDQARSHLENAYGQVQLSGRLKGLRQSLLAAVETCPYCGFGEPTELDHYLPKSEHGELAIYPRNLIPSCGPCNNAKRTLVPGQGRSLVHGYFQQLPDMTFLRADVTMVGKALDVRFRIDPAGLSQKLADSLDYQLKRLKLNDRYPKQINKFVSEQRTGILTFLELAGPAAALENYLQRCASSLEDNYGRNDWRVALLRGLATNATFCTDPSTYLGVRLAEAIPGDGVGP